MNKLSEYVDKNLIYDEYDGEMEFGLLHFIDILKRLRYCKIKRANIFNRIIASFYDVLDDYDESGHNHIFLMLDRGKFYSRNISIDVDTIYVEIMDTYNKFETLRKSKKIRPKEASFDIRVHDNNLEIDYILRDEVILSSIHSLDEIDSSIVESFNILTSRIIPNGIELDIDHKEVMDTLSSNPNIYYFKPILDNRVIKCPMVKSHFFGLRNMELMGIRVNRILLNDIISNDVYLYTTIFIKNKIVEIHSSYIIAIE